MSLWTPDGERPVDRRADAGPDPVAGPDPLAGLSPEQRAELDALPPEQRRQAEQLVAQMAETRRQVLETPAHVIVTNHAMGLYELAAIHLGADEANLDEARLAIDALAGVLDATGERLGPDGETLRDALAQIQLAFVQVRAAAEAGAAAPPPAED
ncbi:MAG TPA: hypothetical protein VK866_05925 [Acidimicrobiales bacterium]|nr:hypothetical protein [Acidimicrobiales bacterium]